LWNRSEAIDTDSVVAIGKTAADFREVLECASPLALWMGYESGRGLPLSKTLTRRSALPDDWFHHWVFG